MGTLNLKNVCYCQEFPLFFCSFLSSKNNGSLYLDLFEIDFVDDKLLTSLLASIV